MDPNVYSYLSVRLDATIPIFAFFFKIIYAKNVIFLHKGDIIMFRTKLFDYNSQSTKPKSATTIVGTQDSLHRS